MDTKGYGRIPPVLCHWISFLAHALPLRSVPTLVELLIGALLSRRGLVTEAWLAVNAQRHWTSYYQWLQRGRWSWVRLGKSLGRLLCSQFSRRVSPRCPHCHRGGVTNIQVTINTEAPGLAAEEVEQLITFPIEAVMYALPDVEEVRSISKTGLSVITVVFKEGTDIYFARQLVFERLQAAREQIPEGVGVPEMGPNTSGLGQVFQYVLHTEDPSRYDITTLRSLNDWVVKLPGWSSRPMSRGGTWAVLWRNSTGAS
jgi:hypothetical protein